MTDQEYAEGLATWWGNFLGRANPAIRFEAGEEGHTHVVRQYYNGSLTCVWTIAQDNSGAFASHAMDMIPLSDMPWSNKGNN